MPRRSSRSRPFSKAVGFLVLVVLVIMAPWIVARVGSLGRVETAAASQPEQVGVVLGAAVQPSGEPSAFLAARLELASELWEAGKLDAIVVSGNTEENYDEPEAMKRALVAEGVDADAIVEDPAGFDTYDTCVRLKQIYGVDEVVLISQYYHLPRAVTVCRMVGVDATGVGDATVRSSSTRTWLYGEVREIPAAWKMLLDVGTRRQPTLGRTDSSVREILGE